MKAHISLMFHRVGTGKHSNSYEMLKSHLEYIKDSYPVILPGDPLKKGLSVCLTFDDATYDFYHAVFPLLKSLNLRALLGVPVRYILDNTDQTSEARLSVPYPLMMQDGIFETKAPFCTWQELTEMVQSGHVEVASHSLTHANLTFPFVKLEREVCVSKQILEERLPQAITSFIYPFGRCNARAHDFVKQHYQYAFRIGSAMNFGWNSSQPLFRVPADGLPFYDAPFRLKHKLRYFVNSLQKNVSKL